MTDINDPLALLQWQKDLAIIEYQKAKDRMERWRAFIWSCDVAMDVIKKEKEESK